MKATTKKKVVTKKAVAKKATAKKAVVKKAAPPAPKISAAQLRTLRNMRGWTQEQLAERIGVSFMTVNRWENGKFSPSAPFAIKLAKLMQK
jgi:DNA-binding XRE family transcriptional regulator